MSSDPSGSLDRVVASVGSDGKGHVVAKIIVVALWSLNDTVAVALSTSAVVSVLPLLPCGKRLTVPSTCPCPQQ